MKIDVNNLNSVMVEITSNCNAMCLQCARNKDGTEVNPLLPIGKDGILELDTFKNFFNYDVLQGIKTIQFNGNFGDPSAYPNFFDILDYIIENTKNRKTKIQIEYHTNGGIRSPKWWKKLGNYFCNFFDDSSYVEFGIDGIDNKTHQMYRQNVNYDKVIQNAKSFISGGGHAHWQFLSFEHNQHLTDRVKNISQELGFRKIFIKTRRLNVEILKMFENKQNKKTVPVVKNMSKKGLSNLEKIVKEKYDNNIDKYYSEGEVNCEWHQKNKLYLAFDGEVHRCCHTSGAYVPYGDKKKWAEWNEKYGNRYEKNWNNIKFNSLDKIIEHPFFTNDLEQSFSNNFNSKINKKLKECTRRCGEHTIIQNTVVL
tara:strand:- start:1643 stop:2746 length:1104 start_codon:yes stop_codon:yes gene_type:complete